MDFSRLPRDSFVGKILRAPLAALPDDLALPILQGPARGMRWVVGSGTHGCWLGSYEYEKRRVFESLIQPGSTFYDIGANVGYFTLVAAALVGEEGHVVAFEPLPENIRFLRRHVEMNDLRNARVVDAAVSDRSDVRRFAPGKNRSTGRVVETGELTIRSVSIDEWIAREDVPPPDVMKIDVQGSESEILRGARETVDRHRPFLQLETHGWKSQDFVLSFLSNHDYRVERIVSDEYLARPSHRG